MVKLTTRVFDLPLRHVFRITRGAVSVQRTIVVTAEWQGLRGYGEATENDYYDATAETMAGVVARIERLLADWQPGDPTDAISAIAAEIPEIENGRFEAFAISAVDAALHDLWGKAQGKPVATLLGLDPATGPDSNYTIGIDEIPKMVSKLNESPGWPVYKIKLGTGSELETIRELRRHTDATFRVDANCGWNAEQAIDFSGELKELGVEFIEQPLPPEDRDGQRKVFESSALPLIADESCVVEGDVARCDGLFHGINIKLCKCAGMSRARRMAADARARGLQLMMGCMTESTVGISAIGHLTPLLDYVDMDGAVLLAADVASGVRVEQGRRSPLTEPGLGIELLADAEQYEVTA
ncbi:MAG: dipeptide epimerase [Planctomycetota bacterium]